MTERLRRGGGLAVLGLVLLIVGALSGRNESAGAAMFGIGLVVLVAALIAIGIVLIRGDKPYHKH